jgi:hypothetical protein
MLFHLVPSTGEEEGFGAAVICGICAQGQKNPKRDSDDENLSDDIEEGKEKELLFRRQEIGSMLKSMSHDM